MRSRSSNSKLFILGVMLTFAGCGGCYDLSNPEQVICQNASPYPQVARHWGEMPAGESGSGAQAVSISVSDNSANVRPALEFSYVIPFAGGPLTGARIAIGDTCWFEIPIDRSRADDVVDDVEDPVGYEAVMRAMDASQTEGRLYISGELSGFFNPPDAVAAEYAFQVRGDDGQWSPTAGGGALTLCTETEDQDDCTPSGGGGGGDALASCSDENACLELTGGDVAPFQSQCEGEGGNFSTSPCPGNGGGPTCLGATITSSGVRLPANVYWQADFCSRNPGIDTRTTCVEDLGGSPSGTHCSPP